MSVISTPLPKKILHGEDFELNRNSWQASGLAGWWPLGASTDTRDFGLYGLNGGTQLLGSPPIPVRTTKGGRRCLDFYHSASFYMSGAHWSTTNSHPAEWFDTSYSHTYSAWVNLNTSYDGGFCFVINMCGPINYGTGMVIGSSKMVFLANGSSGIHYGSVVLSKDIWYHIAIVYNGDQTFAMYVDGVLDAAATTSTPQTWTPTSQLPQIGDGIGGNPMDGAMDDVRMYERALGPNEIAAIYNETKGGSPGGIAIPIKRFYNIPFSAAEPEPEPEVPAATHKQIDLVEGPSSSFDVVTEIRDERRGATGRGAFCPVGVVNESAFGTRIDPSTQAGLNRLDERFVRGTNQGDPIA